MPQEHPSYSPAAEFVLADREIARSTITRGAMFCAVAAAVFAAMYWLRGPVEFALPHVVASVMLAGVAAMRPHNPGIPLYLVVAMGLVLFGYQLLLLGHVSNGIVVWFLVPFVAAVLLGMLRLAAFCVVVTVLEVGGVALGAQLGVIPARVALPNPDAVMAISIFSVMGLCGGFAYITLTERRRLMREAATRNEALAHALDESRLARNEAVEASQAKERFFANLTHEIRTPLTGIAGTAELLQQTALSAEQQPLVRALGASTQNLAELVNAMLDHAKMSAGHVGVELAPLNVRDMARDLLNLFQARAADRQLSFAVDVADDAPAWIETDGVKLRQIVGNLVSNAIKFTDRGSVAVRIRCVAADAAGGTLRLHIEVADTGMGIAADKLQAVFAPFVQSDSSISRHYGGTGLGLAISRQLAELLGGSVSVASRLGAGSEFSVDLPVHEVAPPPADAPPPAEASVSAAGLRVLLAEDNRVNQLVACTMLKRLGIEVDVAENGAEAVEMSGRGGYQAIFMDLQMPGMDGIAATLEIRRREQAGGAPRLPIIAMTGNSAEDYGSACTEAGMDGFVMKPVKLDQLRGIVAGLRPLR